MDLGSRLSAAQTARNSTELLAAVKSGFDLLASCGADDAPVNCEAMLLLTQAQAQLQLKQLDEAVLAARRAQTLYEAGGPTNVARAMEAKEFAAFIEVERGQAAVAEKMFEELLEWANVGSRKELPMAQVAAVNMRRTVQTGKAMALYRRATTEANADVRGLCDQALDLLTESLSAHVDAEDVASAKMALNYAVQCFVALKDLDHASEACDKLEAWCRKHEDADGLQLAEARRAEIARIQKQ
jgi:hypothetical protein